MTYIFLPSKPSSPVLESTQLLIQWVLRILFHGAKQTSHFLLAFNLRKYLHAHIRFNAVYSDASAFTCSVTVNTADFCKVISEFKGIRVYTQVVSVLFVKTQMSSKLSTQTRPIVRENAVAEKNTEFIQSYACQRHKNVTVSCWNIASVSLSTIISVSGLLTL
jgi:hypothetical protein